MWRHDISVDPNYFNMENKTRVVILSVLFTVYLSADGKTKVNMFFKAADFIQLTKVRIKVKTFEL